MNKVHLTASILLLTGMMSIASASSSISLDLEQEIYPGETASISTERLARGVPYNVSCSIVDMNNANNKPLVRVGVDLIDWERSFDVELNGTLIKSSYPDKVLQLDKIRNEVIIKGVFSFSNPEGDYYDGGVSKSHYRYLEFTNADQDDIISISSCIATPDLSYYYTY